jgi:endonuclease-3
LKDKDIHSAMTILGKEIQKWQTPIVTQLAQKDRSPFEILLSTILSLRTKDETTREAGNRLFVLGRTPQQILQHTASEIEQAIYPVGFYREKARNILDICHELIKRYGGAVPSEIDKLIQLKGVGRKTANLVVTLGFGKPGICVDTHVHRITNRWGYVKTKTPDQTEVALRKKLPSEYWLVINDYLVTYGQNLCRPVSPFCSQCRLISFCNRIGIDRSR